MGKGLIEAGLAHGRITLQNAAEAINSLHGEVVQNCKVALQKAREAGKHLAEARKHIKHGAFELWVEESCDFSVDSARKYIKLHEHWDELVESAGSLMPMMTINEGIARISQFTREKNKKREEHAKSGTDIPVNFTTSEGEEQPDGNCIKGGNHVWEEDPELEGLFCANCHEQQPAVGQTPDTHAEVGSQNAQEPAKKDSPASLAKGRLSDLRKRIAELLGVVMGLIDELHQASPDQQRRDNSQDGLRIVHDDVRGWE
jgi:hypothetical protein